MPITVLHVFAGGLDPRSGYVIRCQAILETQAADARLEPSAVVLPLRATLPAGGGALWHSIRVVPHPGTLEGSLAPSDRLCRSLYRVRTALGALAGRLSGAGGSVGSGGRQGELLDRARGRAGSKGLVGAFWRLGAISIGAAFVAAEQGLLLRRHERELARIAIEARAEVLHCHSPFGVARAAIRAGRRIGVPVVYEVRGLWEESAAAEGALAGAGAIRRRRRRDTAAMRAADAVVCIGEELRREVIGRGLDPGKVFLAPNGIDPGFARAPDVSAGSDRCDLTLGYVGSVRAFEGLDVVVRGLAELRATGLDVRAIVVGDGAGLDPLRELAARLGVAGRVRFIGSVPRDRVGRYYRLMDVVVLPRADVRVSRIVPPLKPLEAMALGKPVVASDLPAVRELVTHEETGLLFRAGCVRDFAQQCIRLIKNPPLRDRLSVAARSWVTEERTWSRTLGGLPAVYAQILDPTLAPVCPAVRARRS